MATDTLTQPWLIHQQIHPGTVCWCGAVVVDVCVFSSLLSSPFLPHSFVFLFSVHSLFNLKGNYVNKRHREWRVNKQTLQRARLVRTTDIKTHSTNFCGLAPFLWLFKIWGGGCSRLTRRTLSLSFSLSLAHALSLVMSQWEQKFSRRPSSSHSGLNFLWIGPVFFRRALSRQQTHNISIGTRGVVVCMCLDNRDSSPSAHVCLAFVPLISQLFPIISVIFSCKTFGSDQKARSRSVAYRERKCWPRIIGLIIRQ